MKLINRLALISLVASSSIFASVDIDTIRGLKIFQNKGISINAFTEHGSTYHIKGVTVGSNKQSSPFEAYITKDLKEVVIGKGFKTDTQEALKIDIKTNVFLKDASFTIGSGSDEYILFTDPQCPYCQKLEKLLPQMKKNAKFHVFLYPLSFHKNARDMSHYILSQKTNELKQKAMHDIANGSEDYKKIILAASTKDIAHYEELIERQVEIASFFGVSGTPSLFNVGGEAVEWPSLLSKYNVQQPIDMQGILFLEKNNLEIKINKLNKTPIYIFTSLSTDANLKKLQKFISKYKHTNSMSVFLKADSKKSLNRIKVIYSQKSNQKKVKLLNQLLEDKSLDSSLIEESKKMSRDEETKYLPVSYVMQKMKLDSSKDFIALDKNGNIIDIK